MPEAIRPASRLFNHLMRHTLGAWVAYRFHARFDAAALEGLAPPYLVIGNHTCFWDPFLMSVPVPGPVHFVASDEYFRTPFMRFVFSLIGGIPKTKNVRDTQTVRTLLTLKRAGAILGLYPEGNRNWDGVTGPLYGSTAKLIRKLAIPVVLVKTTGGTLSQPRWGRHWRRGWMKLSYRVLFTPEDCQHLADPEILDKLVQALAHDDLEETTITAQQEGLPLVFSGRRLAERLELFLFQCPGCGHADSLSSIDTLLTCTHCGLTVRYGEDGRLHAPERPAADETASSVDVRSVVEPAAPPFATTKQWNHWQCENLADSIRNGRPFPAPSQEEAAPHSIDRALLINEGALLQTGGRTGKLLSQGRGTVTLFANRLRFDALEAGTMPVSLPLSELSGLNIQYNNKFELYRDGTLFRFSFPDAFLSVWKWHQALRYAGVPGADAGDAIADKLKKPEEPAP